nr:membrane protein [Sinorhizobium meliloti]
MTAPAAVAWAAHLDWFDVSGTPLAFMGYRWTPWIFTALALIELVTDQLPNTPSRKVPMQFGARILMGALAGGTVGAAGGSLAGGLLAGTLGAIAGTLGGAAARGKLAAAFRRDTPAALIEDAVATGGALLIVAAVP